jgi:superfamily II DNA helicase RecQ
MMRANEAKVVRIIVDECHQRMTMEGLRRSFEKLHKIAKYPVQKIYLTGSLPTRLEESFIRQVKLPEDVAIIRAHSDQTNLGYHVVNYECGRGQSVADLVASTVELVERQKLGPEGLGMIFVNTCSDAEAIAAVIHGATVSHAGMDKPEDRARNEAAWLAGEAKWMVGTTGLAHGLDSARIQAVIIVSDLFGLINVYQAGGRAGRDGRPAVMVFMRIGQEPLSKPKDDRDAEGAGELQAWVDTPQCRRIILSEFLDGFKKTCADVPSAELCDVCGKNEQFTRGT